MSTPCATVCDSVELWTEQTGSTELIVPAAAPTEYMYTFFELEFIPADSMDGGALKFALSRVREDMNEGIRSAWIRGSLGSNGSWISRIAICRAVAVNSLYFGIHGWL